MQIVDEFGMEIGGGLVVRTPSGFAPKYSSGCPLGFRAMVATANETQQPYSVNRNTSQRLPSQRKRNSSLVHLELVRRKSLNLLKKRSLTVFQIIRNFLRAGQGWSETLRGTDLVAAKLPLNDLS